jgi:periplasmic divalent cation tolerance protein
VSELVTVEINCPDRAVATAIAEALLARRLAAAANVHPQIESLYRWEGDVVRRAEVPLVVKTRAALAVAVGEAARALHPYATPSILTRAVAAPPDYAAWVAAATADPA